MKQDSTTHILLLIAGMLIFVNGILAFEKSVPMATVSIFFIVIGITCTAVASLLIFKKYKS